MFKHFRDSLKNASEFDTASYVNMAKKIIREHEKHSYCDVLKLNEITKAKIKNSKEIYSRFNLNRLF